jgi:class 3 adenylate cyclase/tetratricopeptide (TPR) repeat protein
VIGIDTATVLFTDLVDSTAARARLGEDAADELRRLHDQLLTGAIERHEGAVVKGLGDGLMATFASAADGVAAAVDIQQQLAAHNRRTPNNPLTVRIGVSAGDVVREAGDCFGRPVIEASRLCAAAEGDQILVADVVRLLARNRSEHAFVTVGELELKGLPDPVAASSVSWAPLPAGDAGQLPIPELLDGGARLDFSGRDTELDTVTSAWKEALTGERQAVLLAGEPGIGKTRLAREAALRAHEQGGTVLYGRCEEDLGAPYQPFVEALDYFVRRSDPATLTESLGRYAGDLARLCPQVADVVPDLPPPVESDPETERYRLFEAVASWLATASEPQGLVLVLDDLHWATRPTLVLLQHVLHATAQSRVLVLGTYRDTDLDRAHPLAGLLADLRRVTGVSRVALSGLDVDGVIRLVSHAAGHELEDEGVELARMIHAETEGNPFFVGEILRHLRESGAIYIENGRWVSQLTAAQVGIPEGVREVVGRRLDRLSAEANTALSMAAVIGRDFDLATVAAATGLDEDAALTGLEGASEARLIEETGSGRYRFAHALVRSTLYDELSATRRTRMHLKVGEYVERHDPTAVATLAYHFGNVPVGEAHHKAVKYAKLAGDQAMEQLAHDQAIDSYRDALDLLDDDLDHEVERCEVLVALGEAQRRGGDPQHRQTLLDAGRLARRLGSVDLQVRAALLNTRGFWSMAGEIDQERMAALESALEAVGDEDSADRARMLGQLATELMFSNEDERRSATVDEAIAVARRVGDSTALSDVLVAGAPAILVPWRMQDAVACADEGLTLSAKVGDPTRWTLANLWSFITRMYAGDAEAAEVRIDIVRASASQLAQPTVHWLTTSWTVSRVLMLGELDEAERLATEAYEVGARTGQPDAFTWYAAQLFTIMRERGLAGTLRESVQKEVDDNPGLPAWRVALASLCGDDGDLGPGREALELLIPDGRIGYARDVMWTYTTAFLLDTAEAVGDRARGGLLYNELLPYRALPVHAGVTYQGSAECHLAAGARLLGRYDDAVHHLEAAIAFEERMSAPTWLGLACADLAKTLRLRAGDRSDPAAVADRARADEMTARALELAKQTGSVLVERRAAGSHA